MIEFACDTAAFSDLRLTEALGTIARLGFRYADLDVSQHLNLVKIAADPRRIAAELIADLRVYNLKLANVSLTLPAFLLSDQEAESQTAFDQFTALLPLFQELAVPGITLAIDQRESDKPADSEDIDETAEVDQQVRRADAFSRLQAAADPIALRVHADDVELFGGSDDLKLTLDAAALLDDETASGLLARTRYLTLQAASDGLSRDEAVSLMQTLRDAGYDGVLSVGIQPAAIAPTPIGKSAAATPPVTATRRVLTLRDTLRAARDQVMAPAKKPTPTR